MFGIARQNYVASTLTNPNIRASGGVLDYYINGSTAYKLHTFATTGSQSFVVTTGGYADYLLCGGGGGGGGMSSSSIGGGGGGGGGSVLTGNLLISAQTYSLSIGAGGLGNNGSAGTGVAGGDTTGFSLTAKGGGGGGAGTDNGGSVSGGSGGGAGSNSSTSRTGGTGTYNGGNGFGSNTSSSRAGGGGAGASANGSNGVSSTGGAGGAGVTSSITGTSAMYGPGGGGGSPVSGGNSGNGTTGTGSGAGIGVNNPGYANTINYGGGGGGAANASGSSSYTGGAANDGVAIIAYPTDLVMVKYLAVNSITTGSSVTIPAGSAAGDWAMLSEYAENTSGTPTTVTNSGWTKIIDTTTGTLKVTFHYKQLTSSDISAGSITGMNGTSYNSKVLQVYKSNAFSLSSGSVNSQSTTATPTNQTLSLTGLNGGLGFAIYAAQGTYNSANTSSTVNETRIRNSGRMSVRVFERFDSASTGFSNSTISMTDMGTNAMASFYLNFV